MPDPPYPKNAPGPFYVANQHCITCEAPHAEAPELVVHDVECDYAHCYFQKQPETPEEVEQAIQACLVSCVGAVRYAGNDPAILQRFRELRAEDSCDVLENPGPPPSSAVQGESRSAGRGGVETGARPDGPASGPRPGWLSGIVAWWVARLGRR